ncbi:Zinc-type alcohol dehydrogenase-like protein C16A3.02c [Pseudocercospora fuligena]|uniref:Zinc-type alcohol dehydrogenase-like protein C16A3.02c n=1 Tax=Pseudocercospora fuligena TaxID=685502 RepID=A0A8H6RQ40_9PEZI|nr:Zinc-type alcohol dehydrogenase-like protein C16A3.02c [Pseudocercospora fuligena]
MTVSPPTSHRAWQFKSASGGLEKNLKLNPETPMPKPKHDQHLVQVIAAALNPVDYKLVEIPLFTFFMKKPATPVIDFAGKIVQPADGSSLQPGQIVFGAAGSGISGGALAEYATALPKAVAPVPAGVSPIDAAGVCVAGLSAYQSIVPYVKEGGNVFINGGSGGTGVYGIQIAKAKGCYVTTTCSTPNVELCKSLGADEVIDYKKNDVLKTLKSSGRIYDHVVDNVGADMGLFWKCHEYTRPGAIYVSVGALMSFKFLWEATTARIWPGFLGGGKRKLQGFFAEPRTEDLAQIGTWMQQGKVKTVIDEKFKFEDAPKAFAKLKTGRAKGKVVVEVAPSEA